MPAKRRLALIAFGGNALLPENQRGIQDEQMKNAEKAARAHGPHRPQGL